MLLPMARKIQMRMLPMLKPTALIAMLALGLLPSSTRSQTLFESWQAALKTDSDFLAQQDALDADRENSAQARALYLPNVTASAGLMYSRTTMNAHLPAVLAGEVPLSFSGTVVNGSVQATQPLFDGASLAKARELRAGARAAEARFAGQKQQLMLRVLDAYLDVQAAADALALVRAQEDVARREQRAAQARFDAGRARITDVREAQSRGDNAAAQAIVLSAQHDLALASYRALTGLDGQTIRPLKADVIPVPPVDPLSAWQSRADTASPTITAQQHALDAAMAKADDFGLAGHVKLEANASYQQMWRPGGNNSLLFPDRVGGYVGGVTLSIPFYTGGGMESRRRQALAQAAQSRHELDSALRDLHLQIERAWLGQRNAVAQIAALRVALESARLQERAAITGRDVEIRTQNDVVTAQAFTFDAQRQLDDAIRQYERNRLTLYALSGELSAEQLAWFDADLD